MYENSYMHREDITHVVVSKTDFVREDAHRPAYLKVARALSHER